MHRKKLDSQNLCEASQSVTALAIESHCMHHMVHEQEIITITGQIISYEDLNYMCPH